MMYAGKHHDWKNSHVDVTFDLHHVLLVADECLNLAVMPKNIKAGFKASGVFPFNRYAFTDVDFVAVQSSGKNRSDNENEHQDTQRRVVVLSSCDGIVNEEVLTSEVASTSGILFTSLYDSLKAVGPVKQATPAKKSNRSRKPMQTSILTSPEVVSNLQQRADNRRPTEAQKQKDDTRANSAKQKKIVLQLLQRRISKSHQ
ncbi:unnamed protein product [Hermetia illucens]|uniref:Uncharacterized protein n=1 Tax=Hermetia illucens TaxID=343691 RepID=A0A7R8UQA5_HERIL|nr:unnamed protein product [Hermetia illucens]